MLKGGAATPLFRFQPITILDSGYLLLTVPNARLQHLAGPRFWIFRDPVLCAAHRLAERQYPAHRLTCPLLFVGASGLRCRLERVLLGVSDIGDQPPAIRNAISPDTGISLAF